jgi:hypothetical protein
MKVDVMPASATARPSGWGRISRPCCHDLVHQDGNLVGPAAAAKPHLAVKRDSVAGLRTWGISLLMLRSPMAVHFLLSAKPPSVDFTELVAVGTENL